MISDIKIKSRDSRKLIGRFLIKVSKLSIKDGGRIKD